MSIFPRIFGLGKKKKQRKTFSVVNPPTEEWYEIDENYNVWVGEPEAGLMLNVTICPHLALEGEYRELLRKIAEKRKELGLSPEDPFPDLSP